jgi:hypothetical protein
VAAPPPTGAAASSLMNFMVSLLALHTRPQSRTCGHRPYLDTKKIRGNGRTKLLALRWVPPFH